MKTMEDEQDGDKATSCCWGYALFGKKSSKCDQFSLASYKEHPDKYKELQTKDTSNGKYSSMISDSTKFKHETLSYNEKKENTLDRYRTNCQKSEASICSRESQTKSSPKEQLVLEKDDECSSSRIHKLSESSLDQVIPAVRHGSSHEVFPLVCEDLSSKSADTDQQTSFNGSDLIRESRRKGPSKHTSYSTSTGPHSPSSTTRSQSAHESASLDLVIPAVKHGSSYDVFPLISDDSHCDEVTSPTSSPTVHQVINTGQKLNKGSVSSKTESEFSRTTSCSCKSKKSGNDPRLSVSSLDMDIPSEDVQSPTGVCQYCLYIPPDKQPHALMTSNAHPSVYLNMKSLKASQHHYMNAREVRDSAVAFKHWSIRSSKSSQGDVELDNVCKFRTDRRNTCQQDADPGQKECHSSGKFSTQSSRDMI